MTFLTDEDRKAISSAIREAEQRTSGELVTVLAPSSDDYLYIPLLWSALVALALPALLYALALPMTSVGVYVTQVLTFVALSVVFQYGPIKMRLVPARVKERRAARRAREQFFERGMHHTHTRSGVLIYVSVAERYVEIIADSGIDAAVPDGAWRGVVDDLVRHIRDGRVGAGFVAAVNACGDLLAAAFPREADDVNELANRLVEL